MCCVKHYHANNCSRHHECGYMQMGATHNPCIIIDFLHGPILHGYWTCCFCQAIAQRKVCRSCYGTFLASLPHRRRYMSFLTTLSDLGRCMFNSFLISQVASSVRFKKEGPQSDYPMSFTWASHIATSLLLGRTIPNKKQFYIWTID